MSSIYIDKTTKQAGKITWHRAQFVRKAIPDTCTRTGRREGPILFSGSVRTWYQVVTTRGRAKRSPTRAGQTTPKDTQEQCQRYNAKQWKKKIRDTLVSGKERIIIRL